MAATVGDDLTRSLERRSIEELEAILAKRDETEWRPEIFPVVAAILDRRRREPPPAVKSARDEAADKEWASLAPRPSFVQLLFAALVATLGVTFMEYGVNVPILPALAFASGVALLVSALCPMLVSAPRAAFDRSVCMMVVSLLPAYLAALGHSRWVSGATVVELRWFGHPMSRGLLVLVTLSVLANAWDSWRRHKGLLALAGS
jgi:hypothetical protein